MEISIKFVLVITAINLVNGSSYQRTFRETQVCGFHNGHRKYMELGDTGILSASNISAPTYLQEVSKKLNQSLTLQCTLELVTCPSCVIKVKFNYTNFPSNCEYPMSGGDACRCDHIIIGEPPYDQKNNLVYNCGRLTEYQTKSRSLQIKFVYWNNYTDAFQLEYSVERNREIIALKENGTAVISSPFFPSPYPRDHSLEQVVTCDVENCRIYVVFSDFQLARSSSMEFFDSDGERLFITGAKFRPPILITTGPSLMIRFYANGVADLGYKAIVTFLTSEKSRDPELKVRNGCGGLVESVGGAITMMNMLNTAENETDPLIYDCIWIIRPPLGYMHLKTHILLKVETFEKMESQSEITVLQGTTSDRPVLEKLESSAVKSVSSRNLVIPITSGFYVRLRGKFNSASRIAIVYTAFSYSKCYIGGEFLCDNQRCIPIMLRCDGFNQCGDNSDEPEKCPTEWANSIIDRRWYSHTPNYYFPKIDRFPDLKTTTLAFVVSSMSLLFVISCLILTLYRNGNRSREREEFQNQLHTISQLLDSSNNLRQDETSEPPPTYEAPPTYDEVIKVGMDDQINKIMSNRRSGRRSRLQRPRRSDPAVSYQSGLLSLEEGEIASVSSTAASPTPYHNARSEAYLSSLHLLDITETRETSVRPKSKEIKTTASLVNTNSVTTSFFGAQSMPCSSTFENNNSNSDSRATRHIWSNESKFRKSWILFNSDEHLAATRSAESIDESVDDSYSVEGSVLQSLNENSLTSMNSCFCDSAQSIYSDKIKTSLLINQLECERCKNLLLRRDNRRCSICPDCIEKIYSPKTCATCNGRISYQDLKDTRVLQTVKKKHFNKFLDPLNLKLCNCYPRYQSQQFSLSQLNENCENEVSRQIIVKSYSCDDISAVQLNKKSIQPFYSGTGLPNKASTEDSSSDSE